MNGGYQVTRLPDVTEEESLTFTLSRLLPAGYQMVTKLYGEIV